MRLDGRQSSAKISFSTEAGVQQIFISRFPQSLGATVFWQSPNYVISAGRELRLSAVVPSMRAGHFECEIDTVGEGYSGVSSASASCSVSGTPPFAILPSP
jgi:hypothetical protein